MTLHGELRIIFKSNTTIDVVPRGTAVELLSVKLNSAYDSGCEARIKLTHNGITRAISVDPGILTS